MTIEVRQDMPKKVIYDRMWEYSAHGESEDPDLIKALLNEIKDIKIGKETDLMTDDFSDFIRFQYEDGEIITYEFEADNYVDGDKRYKVVSNLSVLRSLLDPLIEEE